MKIPSWLPVLSGALVLPMLVTACGQSNTTASKTTNKANTAVSNGTKTKKQTLTVGTYTTAQTLDPVTSHTALDLQIMDNIYGTLLKATPKGKLTPNLITSWKVKNGGLAYVFTLKKGVKFQDGTPFNAQAIKDDWERILNPATNSVQKSNLGPVKSIVVNSPTSLTVNLSKPYAPLLDNLTGPVGMIPSPTALKKEGAKQFGNHPVGAGPFAFKSWVPNGAITLIKNTKYWDSGFPLLNKVVFDPITSASTMATALDNGQIQIADVLSPSQVKQVQSSAAHVNRVPGLGWFGLNLNQKSGPLANVHARRAIEYAINRKAIQKVVFKGTGAIANSQFSPTSWAYDSNLKIPYSLSLARKELKKAGDPTGFKLTLQAQNTEKYILVTQAIQSELAKIGIKVHIDLLDTSTYISNLNSGKYQANFINMSGSLDPNSVSYIFDESSSDVVKNGFDDPKVNSLMNKALVTANKSSRQKDYAQAAVLMSKDVPMVNLINPDIIIGVANDVHGFVNYPTKYMYLSSVSIK